MRQDFYNDKKQQFLNIASCQLGILLLLNKLKELHSDLDDRTITAVKENASSLMEDKFYLASIKVIFRNIDVFYGGLIRVSSDAGLIRYFPDIYKQDLRDIVRRFTVKDMQLFILQETKRLKRENIEEVNLDSEDELAEISENKKQKEKVDVLLKKHQDGELVDLNKDNFYSLINEYSTCITIIFGLRKSNLSVKGSLEELKDMQKRALKHIGGLIYRNNESLHWLSGVDLIRDQKQVEDIIKFIHQLCRQGDIRTFETLITKLDRNFDNIISRIPYENILPNYSSVSNKGIITIIEKRISGLDKDSEDCRRWGNILIKFNEVIGLDRSLGELSVSARSEAFLSASQARRLDNSSENVAKSRSEISARGGGGVKR